MDVFNDLKQTIQDEREKLQEKHEKRKTYFKKHISGLKNLKFTAC